MKWFDGSIEEAIAASKARKAIFFVFIEGGNEEMSQAIADLLDIPEVSSRLEEDDFVGIHLHFESDHYRLFAQIYQMIPTPSVYFIDQNGIPLGVLAKKATQAQMMAFIDEVLAKDKRYQEIYKPETKTEEQKPATTPSTSSESSGIEKTDAEKDIPEPKTSSTTDVRSEDTVKSDEITIQSDVKEEAAEIPEPAEPPAKNEEKEEETPMKELTAEEKMERARQLIELQKKQRIEEEEKRERERELERRKVGRDVQQMRRKQQELEIKHVQEERMREKAIEAAAREKVREQIAQDKLERKQKEIAMQQMMQEQQNQEQPKPYLRTTSDANVTRIQFKLPSGNPHTGQFSPTTTLRSLRGYVTENVELPFRRFAMSTTFPRRDLTREDDTKTLEELELVPNAVILILPLKDSHGEVVNAAPDGGFLSLIWTILAPVIGVYNYLIGYFTGGSRRNPDQQRGDADRPRGTSATVGRADVPNLQNIPNSSGLIGRYLGNQGGTTVKTDGNIHRLHSGAEDNDENNTWNGNSTQQM